MKAIRSLFGLKPAAMPLPVLSYALPEPSNVLPGEVDSAIAAAVITVRAFSGNDDPHHDYRTIVEFQGRPGMRYEKAKLSSFFAEEWPQLNELQIRRAVRYVENRCIAEARRIGEAHAVIDSSRKRWSATEW